MYGPGARYPAARDTKAATPFFSYGDAPGLIPGPPRPALLVPRPGEAACACCRHDAPLARCLTRGGLSRAPYRLGVAGGGRQRLLRGPPRKGSSRRRRSRMRRPVLASMKRSDRAGGERRTTTHRNLTAACSCIVGRSYTASTIRPRLRVTATRVSLGVGDVSYTAFTRLPEGTGRTDRIRATSRSGPYRHRSWVPGCPFPTAPSRSLRAPDDALSHAESNPPPATAARAVKRAVLIAGGLTLT